MRKVILYVNLTLDGHLSGPNGELDWMAGALLDPEMNVEFTDAMRERVDTILTGRSFYHGLNESFGAQAKDPNSPPALIDFANWMLNTPKVVFSTTLTEVNEVSTLAKGDLADEVAALKAAPGKDMVLFGGVAAAQSFAERGLVDEYWIKLYPVALGDGQPLFTSLKERANLRLVDSKTWDSGIITVRYVPA
jgi:dihydrofolate reductase